MRAACLAVVVVALVGCGAIEPFPPGDAGRACVIDSECVPDNCCGRGSAAVHVDDAPDCSAVDCPDTCPLTQVACGCGLPVCRDSRCTVAWSADPACE